MTLPVGLVIGLFPLIVDLGPQGGNARLVLDGRPVCEVTEAAPACMVDLGAVPRIHTLDLERLDVGGRVVESARRYLNRGFSGSVRAVGGCEDSREECAFRLTWSHPAKSDPLSIAATVDGRPIPVRDARLRFPSPRSSPAQVLSLEAKFPDGGLAQFTRLLHGSYPEKAEARLEHVEIETAENRSANDLEASLRSAGWKLRAVEQGEIEILFVLEPNGFRTLGKIAAQIGSHTFPAGQDLDRLGPVRFLVAGESLVIRESANGGPRKVPWLRALIDLGSRPEVSRVRVADAVAIGGFHLGAAARRRALVLVLADGATAAANPDASFFSDEGALAYLRDARVPLVIWRIGNGPASGWPAARRIATVEDFARAVADLHSTIDRQWLAWVETGSDAATPGLPDGLAFAGPALLPGLEAEAEARGRGAAASNANGGVNAPVPSADVYALASDARRPGTVIAGTRDGMFSSADAGRTWKSAPMSSASPVFSVAFLGEGSEVLAGTGRVLARGPIGGGDWSFAPLSAVQAIAAGSLRDGVLYASARGTLFVSLDAGRRWTSGAAGIEAAYVSSVALDAENPSSAYAATMGSGVFATTDRGRSWKSVGRELADAGVRCVFVDRSDGLRLLAGTDGGLFVRQEARTGWLAVPGFPRTVVYSLIAKESDPHDLFAGTESGIYESSDGGRTWARNGAVSASTVVTSFAQTTGVLFAGTLGAGIVRVPPATTACRADVSELLVQHDVRRDVRRHVAHGNAPGVGAWR